MRIRTLRFAVRRSQLALLRTEGGWSYLFQTMQASARRKKGIGPKTLQVLALEAAAPHPSENYGRLLSPLQEAHKKRHPAHFASARLGADPSQAFRPGSESRARIAKAQGQDASWCGAANRLGPRLRTSSTRMRSSSSMGANSPFGSQRSARVSSAQQLTEPENSSAGVCGEIVLIWSISFAPLSFGIMRSASTRSIPPRRILSRACSGSVQVTT